MSGKWRSILIGLLVATSWAACADSGFAFAHGHRRYPSGNSPTYPDATSPHGGFSSSNGYYSGRSRIVDAPAPPPRLTPAPSPPGLAK